MPDKTIFDKLRFGVSSKKEFQYYHNKIELLYNLFSVFKYYNYLIYIGSLKHPNNTTRHVL